MMNVDSASQPMSMAKTLTLEFFLVTIKAVSLKLLHDDKLCQALGCFASFNYLNFHFTTVLEMLI